MSPKAQSFRGLIETNPLSREKNKLVSVNEAMALLNLSRQGVLYRIRTCELKANKVGGKWWISI